MLVPFNIMKGENHFIPWGQLGNSAVQGDPVNHWHVVGVLRAFHDLNWRLAVLGRLLHSHTTLAKVHQDLVDGQPVQPGRKCRLTPETANLSKELNEDLLREVFCLRDISHHSQAEGVNPPVVALVKFLEGGHVAFR